MEYKEYKDFGWANGWKETPEIVKKCRDLGHQGSDTPKSHRPYECFEHTVVCHECRYFYKYDSS